MPSPFRPIARPVAGLAIAALVLGFAVAALRSTSVAHAATSSCADPDHDRPDRPSDGLGDVDQVRQGARRRLGRVQRLLAVPAHLRPAPRHQRGGLRLQRRGEPDRRCLRHDPVAGAPDERCPDRGAGDQPDLARDRDQERPPGPRHRPAGDLQRDAAVPVLPRRGAGRDRGREPVRPGHQPDRYLVPGRSEPRAARDRDGPDRRRDRSARRLGAGDDGGRRADEQRLQPVPERDVPRLHADAPDTQRARARERAPRSSGRRCSRRAGPGRARRRPARARDHRPAGRDASGDLQRPAAVPVQPEMPTSRCCGGTAEHQRRRC